MTSARELRRKIEACELQHPAFVSLLEHLKRRIDDALDGFSPRIEWVVGPSRVGKTMVSKALVLLYPQSKVDGRRRIPVLHVFLPNNMSPLLLPNSVLLALGVPLPSRGHTSGVMFNRMVDQLRLAGTVVIIFEEASHLVEVGARVPPRAAGDWFKVLSDTLNITIVLTGVPRLERLFESNEQLRLRASARRTILPYDSREPDGLRAFAACVLTYAELFRDAGWSIEVKPNALVLNCYLLCGGLVGVLSHFARELAARVAYEAPRALSWEDCQAASQDIEASGHPDFPAFAKEAVEPVELAAAYAHVLETNGLSLNRKASAPRRAT